MLEWLRNKLNAGTLKEPEWWRQTMYVGPSSAGKEVNINTAMKVAAVYACVRILSESIGSLPLHIYRRRTDGGKDRANNHPLSWVFGYSPNGEQTPQELFEHVMWSVLLRGTFYAEVERDGRGEVVSITPLDASYMNVRRGDDKRLVFTYQAPGENRIIPQGRIWRVAGMSSDGVTGYSIITQARDAIGVAMAAETHAAKTFANGTRIAGVFEMEGFLKDEQAVERLREDLRKFTGSDNAAKTMILENGLKYKPVAMTNEDAQFLQSRKFQIAEIARMFRVPLHMLNELDKATFSNIEHQSLEFVTHTLRPWCTRIEQSIGRDLMSEREQGRYFAEFKMEALLRGDIKSRNESYAIAIRNGWMNRNEVRTKENMNPVDGLDEYLVPLNMGSSSAEQAFASNSRREVLAVRKAHTEMASDEFAEWLPGFYEQMTEWLVRDGAGLQVAGEYTAWRKQALAQAQNVDALLTKWESEHE